MNTILMRKKRKELNLTQQELAGKCELSRTTIFNYESGLSEPTNENLEILAKILEITEEELMYPSEFIEIEGLGEIEEATIFKLRCRLYDELKLPMETVKRLIKAYEEISGIYEITYSEKINKVIFLDEERKTIESYSFDMFLMQLKSIVSIVHCKGKTKRMKRTIYFNILDSEFNKEGEENNGFYDTEE